MMSQGESGTRDLLIASLT